ncbi:MAG: hypothetical protein H6677_22835 [Candidatus Obscuribacterales bacterium]|nr:hypothetical protein [Candidatus Obscuribacterales bacterium]
MADVYQQLSGVAAPEQPESQTAVVPAVVAASPYDLSSKTWDDMRKTHGDSASSSEAFVCTADDAVGGRF